MNKKLYKFIDIFFRINYTVTCLHVQATYITVNDKNI